ncbi:ComF family protein [Candidatus Lariskella endosymbiont of Hedychridium roseum]|uniref:ComF family protein n=1 Tax=Candidatus Lariskella endosymbiont of Hedychridium roseum TaxID=3077949 RepID=UPI0039779F28
MKISRLPTAYLNKLLNILFPPECITCNSEITEAYTMCDLCWKKLDFITEPNCAKCSLPIQSIALEQKCDINCLHIQHQYSTAKSVFVYESVTRELIHKLKYSTYYQIAQFFAKLICNRFAENIKNYDVVIPVPMHYLRLKERGYNQSSILAVKVAHTLKIKRVFI